MNFGKYEKNENGTNKRILYDYGLPFSKELANNLDKQKERVDGRKASLIIIDGGIGEGKTTLMVHCADYLSGAYPKNDEGYYVYDEEKTIKFKDQLAMGGEEFSNKLTFCFTNKLAVCIYDEAGDFSRRGALTKLNSMVNRLFETFRGLQVIVIMGLPSIRVLDSSLLDKNIIRFGLHCECRNSKYGNFKGYSAYKLNYIIHKMNKLVIKNKAYDFTFPNIRGHFLDLPSERSKKLDKFSTKGKSDLLKVNELKYSGLVNYKDIAKDVRRSVIWVKKMIAKKNIKHNDIYKNAKYFDASVINVLVEEIEK